MDIDIDIDIEQLIESSEDRLWSDGGATNRLLTPEGLRLRAIWRVVGILTAMAGEEERPSEERDRLRTLAGEVEAKRHAEIDIHFAGLKARARARYAENRDEMVAYHRAYRAEHRDKIAAQKAAYDAKNREKCAAKSRAHYAANRDSILARKKAARASAA